MFIANDTIAKKENILYGILEYHECNKASKERKLK
jgi:hypothetical protein